MFLGLLEDFKKKSYTVREMEILFENWRRKVELPTNQTTIENPRKPAEKSTNNSLLRLLKGRQEEQNPNVKTTSTTRKFTREEGSGDLNESEMSVVCLPPTPLKPIQGEVSSQILPLHR